MLRRWLAAPTDWKEQLSDGVDVFEIPRDEWDRHGTGSPLPPSLPEYAPEGRVRRVWHIFYGGREYSRPVRLRVFEYEDGHVFLGLGWPDDGGHFGDGWDISDPGTMAHVAKVLKAGLVEIYGKELESVAT